MARKSRSQKRKHSSKRRRSNRRAPRHSRRKYKKLKGGDNEGENSGFDKIKNYFKSPEGKRAMKFGGAALTIGALGYLAYKNRDKIKGLINTLNSA